MLDIVGKRNRFFLISGLALLICLVALFALGLKFSIEFESGSRLRVSFDQPVEREQLSQVMAGLGYPEAVIETEVLPGGQGDFFIRTRELVENEKDEILDGLSAAFGGVTEKEFGNVSPEAGRETSRTAIIAVALASAGILLYVTWAFRRMPNPFRYGTCAIIALVHDTLITLGVFAILGEVLNWQVDMMFITGILAIIGYSVNNTVVIFDRIRENLLADTHADFAGVVNDSIVETLGRSLTTSFTTLIVLLALLLFVGVSIQNFALVLIVGIIAGTFDSVCVAPSLLVAWDRGDWGGLINRLPLPRTRA